MLPSGRTPLGHVAAAPVSLVPLGCFNQQLLGHEKLETTSIYIQVSIEQLKAVHAKTHPAEAKEGDKKPDSKNDDEQLP